MKKVIMTFALVLTVALAMGSSYAHQWRDTSPTAVPTVAPTETPNPAVTATSTQVATATSSPTQVPTPTSAVTSTPVPTPTSAVTATPTAVATATVKPTGKPHIDKKDPLYIAIKDKYKTVVTLGKDEYKLYNDIRLQNKINWAVKKDLNLESKSKNMTLVKQLEKSIKELGSKMRPLFEKRLSLQIQLTKAYINNDTDQIKKIEDQIAEVNKSIKEKEDEIQALVNKVKDAKVEDKDFLDKIKKANEEIKKLQTQICEAEKNIHSLRHDKSKEWNQFYKAMRAADLKDANTHMDNTVKYKQQINEKLQAVLTLKKQIETILKTI